MSDTRPTFPLMTELFARPGVPVPPDEPYETDASYETADAQHIVAAIDRLTEQQRIGNLIAFEVISGEKNRAEIRKGLGL
jgi:hypothetical protein